MTNTHSRLQPLGSRLLAVILLLVIPALIAGSALGLLSDGMIQSLIQTLDKAAIVESLSDNFAIDDLSSAIEADRAWVSNHPGAFLGHFCALALLLFLVAIGVIRLGGLWKKGLPLAKSAGTLRFIGIVTMLYAIGGAIYAWGWAPETAVATLMPWSALYVTNLIFLSGNPLLTLLLGLTLFFVGGAIRVEIESTPQQ